MHHHFPMPFGTNNVRRRDMTDLDAACTTVEAATEGAEKPAFTPECNNQVIMGTEKQRRSS
jgi:hypothetical protein